MRFLEVVVVLSLCANGSALRLAAMEPSDKAKLVFDIGMNRGEDSDNYLKAGYRVIAVEAEPVLATKNAGLWDADIKSGRLTILNRAIVSTEQEESGANDEIVFYKQELSREAKAELKLLDRMGLAKMCKAFPNNNWCLALNSFAEKEDSNSFLSFMEGALTEAASITKASACPLSEKQLKTGYTRTCPNCPCKAIPVKTVTCTSLIREYGTPHFLKIDIEGFDGLCLRDLTNTTNFGCENLPQYLSFEEQSMNEKPILDTREIIELLESRGYVFKVTQQDAATHRANPSGLWGEEADDVHVGKLWSQGRHTLERTKTAGCGWPLKGKVSMNGEHSLNPCNVLAKLDPSSCAARGAGPKL